jgi:CRP/FNR family cyclic AMP-dependent transcriptional regulator
MSGKKMSPEVELNLIDQIALFRDLAPDELHRIKGLLRRRKLAAGTTLMMAGQPGASVYFILTGTLKVHAEQVDGTDVIISILGPGEIVGELAALDDAGRSASVVSLEESLVAWMERESFMRCLLEMPPMAINLARVLSARLRMANAQIEALSALDAESRVAGQLLAFCDRYGQKQPNGDLYIPIRLTQGDIASMVGASREHVNKILVSYKERSYLSVHPGYHLTIHNPQALTRRRGL